MKTMDNQDDFKRIERKCWYKEMDEIQFNFLFPSNPVIVSQEEEANSRERDKRDKRDEREIREGDQDQIIMLGIIFKTL